VSDEKKTWSGIASDGTRVGGKAPEADVTGAINGEQALVDVKTQADEPQGKRTKRARPKSRADRWAEAISDCRTALEKIEEGKGEFESAMGELQSVKQEYDDWNDNLPDNLRAGTLGDKLEAVASLDLESVEIDMSSAETALDEAEGLDLPMGFGRD
jgi:hypothetical protein